MCRHRAAHRATARALRVGQRYKNSQPCDSLPFDLLTLYFSLFPCPFFIPYVCQQDTLHNTKSTHHNTRNTHTTHITPSLPAAPSFGRPFSSQIKECERIGKEFYKIEQATLERSKKGFTTWIQRLLHVDTGESSSRRHGRCVSVVVESHQEMPVEIQAAMNISSCGWVCIQRR